VIKVSLSYLLFTVFPFGCTTYEGPNDIECYKIQWLDVGCFQSGAKWPDNLTWSELADYNNMNLRYCKPYEFKSSIPEN